MFIYKARVGITSFKPFRNINLSVTSCIWPLAARLNDSSPQESHKHPRPFYSFLPSPFYWRHFVWAASKSQPQQISGGWVSRPRDLSVCHFLRAGKISSATCLQHCTMPTSIPCSRSTTKHIYQARKGHGHHYKTSVGRGRVRTRLYYGADRSRQQGVTTKAALEPRDCCPLPQGVWEIGLTPVSGYSPPSKVISSTSFCPDTRCY